MTGLDDRAVRRRRAREFGFLKSTDSLAELHARSIVLPDGAALLVPVCELHADDERAHHRRSARWRERERLRLPHASSRSPTRARARWLRAGLLDVEDRILFLVCDRHGHPSGTSASPTPPAATRALEVDNVVRGDAGEPGLMSRRAGRADRAGPRRCSARSAIYLRVFEDNVHAVALLRAARLRRRAGASPCARERVDGDREASCPPSPASTSTAFLRMDHAPAAASGTASRSYRRPVDRRRARRSYALDAVRPAGTTIGPATSTALEWTFADYVGVRHALPTSSCTGALHLALLALGIGPATRSSSPT